MAGSAADAISPAVERSQQLLFRPFKAEKWFTLGFTVFLAQCGEGGAGGSFQVPSLPSPGSGASGGGWGTGDLKRLLDDAIRAVHDQRLLYMAIAAGVLLGGLALWLFVAWFSSRAKLMFVESVVHDRVDVPAQWARFAELGFSLFKFRVALTLSVGALGLSAIAAAVTVGRPDLLAGEFLGTRALIAYSIFGLSLVFFGIPFAIAAALLDDFVVPLMTVRGVRVTDGWRAFRGEVLAGNVSRILLFYLLRFLLSMAVAIAVMVLTCITCCLTAVPYLGTVLLLPIFVFHRAYPLYFLEQLGVNIFPLPEPSWAAYDQWRFPR